MRTIQTRVVHIPDPPSHRRFALTGGSASAAEPSRRSPTSLGTDVRRSSPTVPDTMSSCVAKSDNTTSDTRLRVRTGHAAMLGNPMSTHDHSCSTIHTPTVRGAHCLRWFVAPDATQRGAVLHQHCRGYAARRSARQCHCALHRAVIRRSAPGKWCADHVWHCRCAAETTGHAVS